jgi:hypothetical protein
VSYCSKECQRSAWKEHRAECTAKLKDGDGVVPRLSADRTELPITAAGTTTELPDSVIEHMMSFLPLFAEPCVVLLRSAHKCADCKHETSHHGAPLLVRCDLDLVLTCELVCKQWQAITRDPTGTCSAWERACEKDCPPMLPPSRRNYMRWLQLDAECLAGVMYKPPTVMRKLPRLDQFTVTMHFAQPANETGPRFGGGTADGMRSVLTLQHCLAFDNMSDECANLFTSDMDDSVLHTADARGVKCVENMCLSPCCAMACEVTLMAPDGRIARWGTADLSDPVDDGEETGDYSFSNISGERDEVMNYAVSARFGPRLYIDGHVFAFRAGMYAPGSIAGPIFRTELFLESNSPLMALVGGTGPPGMREAYRSDVDFLRDRMTEAMLVDALLKGLTWQ